ncbi:autoinducer 2 ABC transporter substrate-binding protein [Faecalicatena acetigenes]|uniref:Autoinducer 2 ABC transporter substrate-binding protein n=1 Tax=Faecalicatena acetigenes TaxID=2981790 RepID=A0ABT2T7K6_9FIRM|nr:MULTISPECIES: autoinducer 2 ABC transporter substrate-binding protein [Lachnospiraceae]MCU6746212.1 autoinducer 2 ABC transporter substrate-binding protein [Faecalicatena acetigenes]SCH01643.1 Autoinducer 2-binding protein lsrB precursor [uncultured Clostridium sp.]
MKKKLLSLFLVSVMAFSLVACGTIDNQTADTSSSEKSSGGSDSSSYTIAVVPKTTSLSWYERMEEGVQEYAKENNVDAFFTGPSEADGALQAQYIEDLISQGVDAICVVPLSTESLEPVLKKAREAGIVVITHEGAGMENIDYDLEAFSNVEYGERLMEVLGEAVGGEGEYIQIVSGLTSASHIEWTAAAQEYAAENYPNLTMYGDLIESNDDQSTAYEKVVEALTANPNINAIMGCSMTDASGAALAVEELGLTGQVKIVGTGLVSNAGDYVRNGTIDMATFWDPALAGEALIEMAVMTLNGEQLAEGADLGVDGYTKMTLEGNVLQGQAWIEVTEDNVDDPAYDF